MKYVERKGEANMTGNRAIAKVKVPGFNRIICAYGSKKAPLIASSIVGLVAGKSCCSYRLLTHSDTAALINNKDYFIKTKKEFIAVTGAGSVCKKHMLITESGIRKVAAKTKPEFAKRLLHLANEMAKLNRPVKQKLPTLKQEPSNIKILRKQTGGGVTMAAKLEEIIEAMVDQVIEKRMANKLRRV